MKKTFDLSDFIDKAVRSRKYTAQTGHILKSALKLFTEEANEEELNSLDLFKKNLEQIYQNVFHKNSKDFSASSLATYKSRVLRILNDFEKYGVDATKMANWSPKIVNRLKPIAKSKASNKDTKQEMVTSPEVSSRPNVHRIELALRPDAKFILEVPKNISATEVKMVKTILDSLAIGESENGKS